MKLVFSRREEFFAVDHRREGMVIELETGARARRHARRAPRAARARQGRLLRRGRLLRADGRDARAAARTRSRTSTSSRRSSTRTTSRRRSIRAPTAPQVCWALEQHMDELASALDLDPVELRRRTLIEEGSAAADAARCSSAIGMKETLERAVELIGYGRGAARGRGDRRRVRLVAVLRRERGRLREAQRRRHRDDRHRRAGERHRRRDGLPLLVAEELGMQPGGLLAPLPGHRRRARGTWARAARRRRSTAAARSSRRRSRCASSCSTPPRRSSRPTATISSWPTARSASRARRRGR